MDIDKKLEYIKLLDKLSETFGESEEQTPDEVREELREDEIDLETEEAELLSFQKNIAMKAKMRVLDNAKEERKKFDVRVNEIVDKIKSWTNEQVIEKIKELADSDPELVVAYREYESGESSDIEDMKEMLTDILISKLPPEDNDDES